MELDGRDPALDGPPPASHGGGPEASGPGGGEEAAEGPPGAAGAGNGGEAEPPRCPGQEGDVEGARPPPEEEEDPGPGPDPGPLVVRTPAYRVELPPCHGLPGPSLGELPPTTQEAEPLRPPEPARELPARGKCLVDNWQEERATNHLDRVPSLDGGSEGFVYRHGHRGLLSLDVLAGSATSTTMKDSYRRPRRTGLPVRGQRQAMLEWCLYQKHSKDVFEEQVATSHPPMDAKSVTRQDYGREGFLSVPPAPTKPHDYRLEQPRTFWTEHARQVPGVSAIRTSDMPFRKCATFTTPVTEYLDQPMPYDPGNCPNL
uniref:Sperm-associated antigen 8 n=1 Tax=Pogona vitticeps TaxID=103695 RepID=A0ABM5FUX9_9SAUR